MAATLLPNPLENASINHIGFCSRYYCILTTTSFVRVDFYNRVSIRVIAKVPFAAACTVVDIWYGISYTSICTLPRRQMIKLPFFISLLYVYMLMLYMAIIIIINNNNIIQ